MTDGLLMMDGCMMYKVALQRVSPNRLAGSPRPQISAQSMRYDAPHRPYHAKVEMCVLFATSNYLKSHGVPNIKSTISKLCATTQKLCSRRAQEAIENHLAFASHAAF